MDSERATQIKHLTRTGLDWSRLLRTARPHGMMPLLYWHLKTICPELVPPSTLQELRDHFHANSRRNLFLVAELLEILNLLRDNGISAVPYKGPVLATSVYGNVALRQVFDLDIVVPKSQALKASDLLRLRGYRARLPLSGWQVGAFLDTECEFAQTRADGSILVEVHWEIAPRRMVVSIDLQQLWRRLVVESFAGTTVLAFPPEDLLLALCMHGTKHVWSRLDWICDVSELVRRHRDIDWQRVVVQAELLGGRRMLFLALFLAHDLLGAEIPAEILEKSSADRVVRSLAAQVRRRLFDGSSESLNRLAVSLFHLRTMDRLWDKIKYSSHLAATPDTDDWQLLQLPASLHFLYCLVRIMRLVVKLGPVLLRGVVSISRRSIRSRQLHGV